MPEKNTGVEQILRQAIRFEEDAYDFYIDAVEMVKRSHIKSVLQDLAAEEVKHKERLQDLLEGDTETIISMQGRKKIEDLKLAEYLVAPSLEDDATFQDVLLVAMHREKSSYDFYSTMAEVAGEEVAKSLFEFLAQEELVHKNKVETLYDEVVYAEF